MERKFATVFKELTGYEPLPWQSRLYDRLHAGDIPRVCDIPTGLGKTMVIPIWLIALKHQQMAGHVTLPIRLAYIIDRRTVVDQATEVVGQIVVGQIRKKWTDPLAVSTLRGELADNGEWKKDLSVPAIIIGTIDMVGSKLLFNGYGDGRYGRVHHAGLVGQDTLWVHDEAHITPAFSALLHQVQQAQEKSHEMRPIQVMELTATPRSDQDVLRLSSLDYLHPIVKERIHAEKNVKLHEVEKNKIKARIVELATRHTSAKVLIYVHTPSEVKAIAKSLDTALTKERRALAKSRGEKYRKQSNDHRIAVLNGRMRGEERDQLVRSNEVYRKFLNAESVDESIYLVCTSAGEVGIDIDADHMVCNMTTMDSLIQRLGRVNRQGLKRAQVDIVYDEKIDEKEDKKQPAPSQVTCNILKRWGEFNGSPKNLRTLLSELTDTERNDAFSSTAQETPLKDVILDEWAMTSVDRIPSRLNVPQYLHGREDYRPMIHVVWRQEIDLFKEYGSTDKRTLTDWFRMCPVRSRERLPVLLSETKKELSKMEGSAVRIDTAGDAEWIKLSELADIDDQSDCTLVLSPTSGGLDSSGMLDIAAKKPVVDVADSDSERERRLEIGDIPPLDKSDWSKRGHVLLHEDDENDPVKLVLYMPVSDMPAEHAKFRQTLEKHTRRIVEDVRTIASQLGLAAEVSAALTCAAWYHDMGKQAQIWQEYANNNAHGSEPLAKSKSYGNPRNLRGYRHELGSLVQAIDDGIDSDLLLHLIATHHGWSRPHFKENAYDHVKLEERSEIAVSARIRFDRLQRQYGRWTLAWLESILRCADALASTKEIKEEN